MAGMRKAATRDMSAAAGRARDAARFEFRENGRGIAASERRGRSLAGGRRTGGRELELALLTHGCVNASAARTEVDERAPRSVSPALLPTRVESVRGVRRLSALRYVFKFKR